MLISPDFLPCPSCSGLNAPDSKFCRHCGHALDGAAMAAPAAPESAAPAETAVVAEPIAAESAPSAEAGESAEERSSPAEIDARRARQLLERAQGLSERNDTAGAILACRQALALSPGVAGGQALLGGLLERTGDLTHAVQAFEKAARLEPTGGATRDVERLRDKMGAKPEAPIFHFDDAELFGDETAPATAQNLAAKGAPAVGAGVPQSLEAAPAVVTPAEAAPSPAKGTSESAVAASATATTETTSSPAAPAVAAAIPPVRERRVASVPVRIERRVNPSVAPSSPLSTPIGARVVAPMAAAPVVNPIAFAGTDAAPQGWSALWARPSYYGRSLPLVAATVLSLGFLGWARGLADARNLANAPTIVANNPTSQTPVVGAPLVTNPNPNSGLPPLAPVGSAPVQNGGFPISNQPAGTVTAPPLAPNNAPTPGATAPTRPATVSSTTRTTRTTSPRNSARSPQLLAPAPIPAPNANARGGARGDGGLNLPAPVISSPEPAAPPTSVLPSGGTPALNPAGSSARGYVRITQGRVGSILPSRPSASANTAERAAAAAARNGSTAQAIDSLTNSINANTGDAGFRFQQRAQLFLSQADYARAADDFQSAISAYNEQINRGDQVASARAGLRAARSGLNLALAGGR